MIGSVIRMLVDYVSHVPICPKLKRMLTDRPEWEDIANLLGTNPSMLRLRQFKGHFEASQTFLCLSRQPTVSAALVSTGYQRSHESQDTE